MSGGRIVRARTQSGIFAGSVRAKSRYMLHAPRWVMCSMVTSEASVSGFLNRSLLAISPSALDQLRDVPCSKPRADLRKGGLNPADVCLLVVAS